MSPAFLSEVLETSFFTFLIRNFLVYALPSNNGKKRTFFISLYVRAQAHLLPCDNVDLSSSNRRSIWEVTLLIVLLFTLLELNVMPETCTTQNQWSATCSWGSPLFSTSDAVYFSPCNLVVLWTLKEKLHGYVIIFQMGYLGEIVP